jgi:hypothetical protein
MGARGRLDGHEGSSGKANYNDLMLALRYLYVLALVVWLGGMVVLGAIVAPTTFQVLQLQAADGGRALAGELFGAMLARFQYVAYACGASIVITLALMALLGPRPTGFAVRLVVAAAMLGVALYAGLAVLTEIDGIRHALATLPSRLPAGDLRRVRFDALHQLSTRLMMANVAGALVLLYWEARDHGR